MTTKDKQFSFEFFPPKTDAGREKLRATRDELNALGPSYFSVTYGAGGSTRDNTRDVVVEIHEAGIDVAPHLSVGGDTAAEILPMLEDYHAQGIRRIVALRGDLPSGMGGARQLVYANELVAFIRKHYGDDFHIEVAAYPEIHPDSKSADSDLHYLKAKFDAGANAGITQYFYNIDAYFHLLERCQKVGIDAPIYAGIMPITNYSNLARFSANCGAEIPRWLGRQMEAFGEDQDAIREFGTEFVTRMCEKLLQGGAPGLHFYSMNMVEPSKTIWNNLGI